MARAAEDLDIAGIAVFTETGTTARLLSKYRPSAPIYALSPMESAINRMSLLWGTTPVLCPRSHNTDQMVELAENLLEKSGYIEERQVLGIVAGTRTKSGSTNFLRLHYVGDRDTAVSTKSSARSVARRPEKSVPVERTAVPVEVTEGDQPKTITAPAHKAVRVRVAAPAKPAQPRHKLHQRRGR
jgi:pyruvate kinase